MAAEVVWARRLLVLVGGSVDASAAVLSAVMAGLAAGGAVFGRLASRRPDPVRSLVLLALAAGLISLMPLLLSGPASALYPALFDSFLPRWLVRAVLALVLLGIPAALAGGIVPLLALLADGSGGGREISRLYGWNSAGAAFGGLAAGLVMLEAAGALRTLLAAAALMAASSLFLRRPAPSPAPAPLLHALPRARVMVLYGLSGMIALAWETVWARQLTFLLGNSTYAFSIMGASALLGMGAGSLAGRALTGRTRPLLLFASAEAALSLLGLLPLVATATLSGFLDGLGLSGPARGIAWNVLAAASIIPAAACMGATFPFAVAAGSREGSLGPDVGRLSMANCIGAAVGPFLATRIVFPLAGVTAGAGVLAVSGCLVGVAACAAAGRIRFAFLPSVLAASAIVLTRSVPPPGSGAPAPGLDLLFFDEDRTATVSVFGRDWDGYRSLRINGVEEVPVDQASMEAFDLLGHLPWGYRPDARDVLVVAMGGGITAGALLSHPVDTLVCVEICPAVALAAPLFEAENNRPDLDPRFELVEDDGRNYVAGCDRTWDIIVCDATHPGSSDSWVLYTREFYSDVLARLSPGGVAAQWLPLHQLPPDDMADILATWSGVFPETAFHMAGGRHVIMIGSMDPLDLDVGAMFDTPSAREMLEDAAFRETEPEWLEPAATGADVSEIARLSTVNTDDRAGCQFIRRRAPSDPQATISPCAALLLSLGGGGDAVRNSQMLYWMGRLPEAVMEVRNAPPSAMARRWLSVYLSTAAEQLAQAGDSAGARDLALQALEADGAWSRPVDLLAAIEDRSR
jgi:spermidine synthase